MKPSVLTRLVRVDELDAMCAEVERLRAINANLRIMVDGLETAAHEERAAVVAWLRAAPTTRMWRQAPMDDAADCIERGEHRREEEK